MRADARTARTAPDVQQQQAGFYYQSPASSMSSRAAAAPDVQQQQVSARTAYVSIRQHTSAYVSIRQHASAYVSMLQHTSAYVSIRQRRVRLARTHYESSVNAVGRLYTLTRLYKHRQTPPQTHPRDTY